MFAISLSGKLRKYKVFKLNIETTTIIMRALGLVFSARAHGNCYYCIKYCLDLLEKQGFKVQLVNAYDYEIKPCSHCSYECFSKDIRGIEERCPVNGDAPRIYAQMSDADILISGIPCYRGHTSNLYRAFIERTQSLSWEEPEKMFMKN